ncbi:MAG: thioredoxin domain-containing protein [Myxococcales bacterium]|nr:thioredoxin domain-containing protein [Myxococcales bacterium]
MKGTIVAALLVVGVVGGVIWWSGSGESGDGGGARARAGTGTGTAARGAKKAPRRANHLLGQRSQYLRQHLYNPVDWYPWGEAALARAKMLGRPIFLSIGYASCHWCHVMEREVFENEDVARYLNAHFVSIKVDREERPDIDAVYMQAVQMMTGGGGWPLTAFLLPDLRPFYGATYIPRERFAKLLRRLVDLYAKRRQTLEGAAARLYAAVSAEEKRAAADARVDAKLVERSVRALIARVDPTWGGTRGRMKFPTPARWSLLMHYYRKHGDKAAAQAVKLTLDKMASGGIYDHIGGGFHRYATDARWLVPHFEKMLYDNAQLALLYIEAARVFGDARYERVARETLEFLLRRMRDEKSGAFYASYDADSGGHEGTFYVWTPAQIEAAVPGADGRELAKLLGIGASKGSASTAVARFEGAWIPTWRAEGHVAGRALLERYRQRLQEVRAKRVWPGLDKKVVTSWNALAIRAFAAAARAFGEPRYLAVARKAADTLWSVHRGKAAADDVELARASNDGKASGVAVLDDYAYLAEAYLELFESGQRLGDFRRVMALIGAAEKRFVRAEGGGYYFTQRQSESPLGRPMRFYDGVRPAAQAVLLRAQLRAAAMRGDETLRARARRGLKAASARLASDGALEMPSWLDVLLLDGGPFYEVVIAGGGGSASDGTCSAFDHELRRRFARYTATIHVPAKGSSKALLDALPATENKIALGGKPTAYVCRFGQCKAPTTDPKVFARQLSQGWQR